MAEADPRYDCTICLGPISMRPEKAENRVWDTAVEPGGWCHRRCWEDEQKTPSREEMVLREIFGHSNARVRQRRAPQIIAERGDLIIRRPVGGENTDG